MHSPLAYPMHSFSFSTAGVPHLTPCPATPPERNGSQHQNATECSGEVSNQRVSRENLAHLSPSATLHLRGLGAGNSNPQQARKQRDSPCPQHRICAHSPKSPVASLAVSVLLAFLRSNTASGGPTQPFFDPVPAHFLPFLVNPDLKPCGSLTNPRR
jgi:hypothetical protein